MLFKHVGLYTYTIPRAYFSTFPVAFASVPHLLPPTLLYFCNEGRIAHDFTSTLIVLGCNVTVVASATSSLPIIDTVPANKSDNTTTITKTTAAPASALTRAKNFATQFSIPTYYDSYKKMASDPNVDIVYVATTNQNHINPTLLMLRAGKNVLVEKPTAITYQEAKLMYDEAEVNHNAWFA